MELFKKLIVNIMNLFCEQGLFNHGEEGEIHTVLVELLDLWSSFFFVPD
jgi:hypothetical protein